MEANEQKLVMENPGLPIIPFIDKNTISFDECKRFAMKLGDSQE